MTTDKSLVTILRWIARVLAVCLLLFWGAFFVEHLSWFFGSLPRTPPFRIWVAQGLHLLMLVGFILALKWELTGSVLVAVSALLFFSQVAGKNFFIFFPVTIVPALLYLYCWLKSGKGTPESQ
jgi:hypothetical protein